MKSINQLIVLSVATICGVNGVSALTDSESASILFMKQEEKLARDVYSFLATLYDVPVFANIAKAEQRHMKAVDYLIQTNGLSDTTPVAAGEYTFTELSDLYSQLTAKGTLSQLDALEVGVLIEETDIEDLENELETSTDVTLNSIYQNLLRGSYNHLNAFNNAISNEASATCTPNLNSGVTAGNGICINASVETGSSTNASGMQLSIQGKKANGTGPWRTIAAGQSNGMNGKITAQANLNTSTDAMLYRARLNSGKQAFYSNSVCSQLVNTPWSDGTFLGQGWYATWMGNLFIGQYPAVYSERFGWIKVQSFVDGNLWYIDENGKTWMTNEERYPWIYNPESGEWI